MSVIDPFLEAALKYINRGWHIFPVWPATKKPATKHGYKDATTDEARVRGWFWNGKFDIALATGMISGVIVMDVDPRNGGNESLAEYIRRFGPIAHTPISRTGGGGLHIFFHAARPCRTYEWMPGLEIKADKGQVKLPPSRHESGGTYRMGPAPIEIHAEIAEALVQAERPREAPTVLPLPPESRKASERYYLAAAQNLRERLSLTGTGARNRALFIAAATLGNIAHIAGEHEKWALDALLAAAQIAGLNRIEAQNTIKSGFETGLKAPRNIEFGGPRRG